MRYLFHVSKLFAMRFVILLFALVRVQLATAQTPAELKAKLPQAAGWSINETVEVFDSNNLYERINGAAPGYFFFEFKELTCFEYNQKRAGDNLPYITVQVYRHATNEDAFGIYASERPSETNFINIGTEGYQEGSMLNFFVDRLYVKIESPSTDDDVVKAVTQIAQELARNVNPQSTFPTQLQNLPAENKITRSEQYIPSGYLGHDFLNRAFTANYTAAGRKYQLFIIDAGSAELANAMLSKYLQFTKQDIMLREGRLTIKDRYNGDVECQWKGRYIWGIVNDNNAPVKVDDVLNNTGKNF